MTWTYDPETKIGQVRLLGRENVQEKSVLQDEDIAAFLVLEEFDVRLAAANVLDHLANTQNLLLRKLELAGALKTDGPAVSAELRAAAMTLRAQAYGNDLDGHFDYAEMAFDEFSAREVWAKSRARIR